MRGLRLFAGRQKATGRSLRWRAAVPLAVALAGALFATSATNARGTDLRPGRYTDLPALVTAQRDRVEALQARVEERQAEVDAAARRVNGERLRRLEAAIDALEPVTGLTPVRGPGLAVTLNDAPDDVPRPGGVDANLFVVHQQDLQAVVNALWAGGAEAMTLQGQRIISTTGIKCVGNTVVLHDVPYSPPYRIVAVGDPQALRAGLAASHYVDNYLDYVGPPYHLGWSVETLRRVRLPAYEGALDLRYARADAAGSGQG